MAELVDALDSKSSAARRAGSIPALGTNRLQAVLSDESRFFLMCAQFRKIGLVPQKHQSDAGSIPADSTRINIGKPR